MNDQYVLLLESGAFINFIHEKFGVETFDRQPRCSIGMLHIDDQAQSVHEEIIWL